MLLCLSFTVSQGFGWSGEVYVCSVFFFLLLLLTLCFITVDHQSLWRAKVPCTYPSNFFLDCQKNVGLQCVVCMYSMCVLWVVNMHREKKNVANNRDGRKKKIPIPCLILTVCSSIIPLQGSHLLHSLYIQECIKVFLNLLQKLVFIIKKQNFAYSYTRWMRTNINTLYIAPLEHSHVCIKKRPPPNLPYMVNNFLELKHFVKNKQTPDDVKIQFC